MKKIIKIGIILYILLSLCMSSTYANTIKRTIKVEKDESTTLQTTEDIILNKKIVKATDEQITIQLKLENTFAQSPEIVFIQDNSSSMDNNGVNKKQALIRANKQIITNMYNNISNVKTGLVSFDTNATILSELTNNKEKIISILNNIYNSIPYGETNIFDGLQRAESLFSNESKKIIVLATDGLPTINANETIGKLIELEQKGIDIITILIDMDVENKIVQDIFGTIESPTAGKMYDVKNTELQEISNQICKILNESATGTVKNIEITDYLPQEIVDNFAITTNVIDGTIEKEDNSIIWKLDSLSKNETAILEYTLKLKDDIDKNIVGKIVDTNDSVNLKYTDFNNSIKEENIKDNPQIKIEEETIKDDNKVNEENNGINNVLDNTTAPNKIPQTGEQTIKLTFAILGITGISVYLYTKYRKINN